MTAIVTKNQRIHNAKNFIADFSGSPQENYLYLWIGKSDPWNDDINSSVDGTIDIPIDGEYEKSKIYNEMLAMKRVLEDNMVLAVPTNVWTAGVTYQAWDDAYAASVTEGGCPLTKTIYDTQFYVITNTFNVYKCLVAGPGASTQQPTHMDAGSIEPLLYPDGYVWHYMFTVSTNDTLIFYNNSFFPVRERETQHADQSDIEGGVFRVVVEDGGAEYSDATTTVTIEGNGSGAVAEAVIVAGEITAINITTNISNHVNHGTGYDYARVVITDSGSGTGAKARAVLSPRGGHGYDPISELGAYNIEIAIDIEGDEEGKFITANDYRRIGLIRNPMTSDSPPATATSMLLNCLSSLELSGVSGTFSSDDIVVEDAAGGDGTDVAMAFVDQYVSGTPDRIYFHQNSKTGWNPFTVGMGISSSETNAATIDAVVDSDYTPFTGDIIFMENRAAIQRTESTREEIRLIVQF